MEKWKVIENTYNMFSISDKGNIKNNKTGRVLKLQRNHKGYLEVRVTINKIKKTLKPHRLVAFYFVENKENKPQVNHIDGNKENNNVNNLEWVTNHENAQHAIINGLWNNVFKASQTENNKRKKKIIARNISTEEIIEFESISEAERTLKTKHIVDVIKGRRTQTKGYVFYYKSEVV